VTRGAISFNLAQRLSIFDGIGKNNLIPDKKVLILFFKMLDLFVDLHELVVGCDVETRSFQEQGLMISGWGLAFTRNSIAPWADFFEGSVIVPQLLVIQDE